MHNSFTRGDDAPGYHPTRNLPWRLKMQKAFSRVFLGLAMILESSAVVRASSIDLPDSTLVSNISNARRADPCRTDNKSIGSSTALQPARISRRGAVYFIRHVEEACRFLADRRDKDPQLAPRLNLIFEELHATLLSPIYRTHPDLKGAVPPTLRQPMVLRATPRDIGKKTASRFIDDMIRLRQQILKLGGSDLDRYGDKSAAEKAMQPFMDAAAELAFAEHIPFDAYPSLFSKLNDAIPQHTRTEESDAGFRKGAPPLGSVRLSEAALALVKSFMRQVRHEMPRDDQIASITWAGAQKSKRPGDTDWIDRGAGWVLGAYSRTQVPPEVIDKIQDVEIIFSAEDPSLLVGKVVDARNTKLFVRD